MVKSKLKWANGKLLKTLLDDEVGVACKKLVWFIFFYRLKPYLVLRPRLIVQNQRKNKKYIHVLCIMYYVLCMMYMYINM